MKRSLAAACLAAILGIAVIGGYMSNPGETTVKLALVLLLVALLWTMWEGGV